MSDFAQSLARSVARVVAGIEALPQSAERRLAAIAGPPGSGKSTLAEAVVDELVARGHAAVLMPMDGFHLDNRLLEPRRLLPRKGAPETFDFGGFASTIARVRREPSVILPVFDRTRDIAIAGAEEIRAETRLVVVEGNYLVLDEDPWRALMPLWDFTAFLDVSREVLERRLIERWLGFGFDLEGAKAKALGNDIPNGLRVLDARAAVDLVVQN